MCALAVVAVGGNSLIKDPAHVSVPSEYEAVHETCQHITRMVYEGWDVVVTHGNGPQVGFNLRRSELARHELFELPLDVCITFTQGSIGYYLQQNLCNYFQQFGIKKPIVTIITQVEVNANDPAFKTPSKPIGAFMTETQARVYENDGWAIMQDGERGWRRVVASPYPQKIIEEATITQLVQSGTVVIAVGGGGVPVVRDENNALHGVFAVIDKDHASALLANDIHADLFVISTAVPQVAINFGKPSQQWLSALNIATAKRYLSEGQFGKGSMAPKIKAAVDYLERGGAKAIITNPENLTQALAGNAGTSITP
jgi:carbamate kinase